MKMIFALAASLLAGAVTVRAIAGDFSEHHGREPAHGSGLAESRERAAVPSGFEGSGMTLGDTLVGGPTDERNIDWSRYPTEKHSPTFFGGQWHDNGESYADGGCDAACRDIEKSYKTDTDGDGTPDAP